MLKMKHVGKKLGKTKNVNKDQQDIYNKSTIEERGAFFPFP